MTPELTSQRIERTSAAAVLRALLLSIFFQRTLENVVPETLDVFDTHVAVVSGDTGIGGKVTDIEREINDKVEGFVRKFVDAGREGGEVSVIGERRAQRAARCLWSTRRASRRRSSTYEWNGLRCKIRDLGVRAGSGG